MSLRKLALFAVPLLLTLAACGGDDDDSTECCVLSTLASRCSSLSSSESGREALSNWNAVASKKDAAACKVVLDSDKLGCSTGSASGSGYFGEADAALVCAGK